ncbi:hypothetical protein BDW66DRAFT_163878 [Aspergillus desertorum]
MPRRDSAMRDRVIPRLILINTLTALPDWHHVVFDQQVTAQWREDAVTSSSLINDKTWDWCLQLARAARQGATVQLRRPPGRPQHKQRFAAVKVCRPVLSSSHSAEARISCGEPYLDRGQSCGMDQYSWSSCSREGPLVSELPQLAKGGSVWPGGPHIWSSKFQWLPCEVDFTGPPGSTDVRISSYINNLHPTKREMYSAIEAVISSSIKQWNEILVRNKWIEWRAQFPEWAKKLPHREDEGKLSAEEYEAMCAQVEAYLLEPESKDEVHWHHVRTRQIPGDWKTRWGLLRTALTKYGHTFDWKAGKTGKAIVGPAHDDYVCRPDYELSLSFDANPWLTPYEWVYKPKEEDPDNHQFYTITLQDEFREHGLQVIVRIHSIELGPETPSFPVANAIYAIDSENMSEPQISFRRRCRKGALPGKLSGFENIQDAPAWQQLGEVKIPTGRLISFPNTFQYQMSPLQLQDKTKGGHCRFLTLSLVDPTYRLCSTRNVPLQQAGWIKGNGAESATQIGLEEALDLREELVKEHAKKGEGVFKLASTPSFPGFS